MPAPNISAWKWWAFASLLLILLFFSGYFLERHQSLLLLGLFASMFLAYVWVCIKRRQVSINSHFYTGLSFRVLLLFMIPNLSDDLYRFIWDGQLTWHGIHPFAQIPSYYAVEGIPSFLSMELFELLNSKEYFTVYPPVSQFFFMVTSAVTGGDIFWSAVIFRTLLIGAEVGSYYLLKRLALMQGIDPRRISWYWLNPLVILEITGNLHFEGFMILFIFLAVLLVLNKHSWMAGVSMGLAIGVKLIPLLFLPVIWKQIGTKAFIQFTLGIAGTLLFYSIPFFDWTFFQGLGDSLSLYFQKFEFNASVYYLVREVGYWHKGYNIIGTAGPYLAVITFFLVIVFAWRQAVARIQMTTSMGISLTIYLMLATTVHPWYILLLVALMLFQSFKYPVLWSALIALSYLGYTETGYEENLWITFFEYAPVIVYMGYEFIFRNRLQFNPFYRPPLV